MTVSFPTFLEQGDSNILEQDVIMAEGETAKGTKIMLNRQSQKPLEYGQIRVLLFSEELAKRGLETYVDSMYRDPAVGNRILLSVVEGEAGELLKSNLGAGEQAGVFLSDLIRQNMESNTIPAMNMHEFLFSLYNDGRDPFLPMLKKRGEEIGVSGTALFAGDRLQTKLDLKDSFYLKLITTPAREANQQFQFEHEGHTNYIVIEKIYSNLIKTVDKSGVSPLFSFLIKVDGEIIDYTGDMNLDEDETIGKIERSIEETIATRIKTLLDQFRDDGIDPVGIGELYRSTTRDWKPEQWKNELYQSSEFEVSVELDIIQSGAVE